MNLDGGDHLLTFTSFPGGKISDLPRDYSYIQSRNPDVVMIHLGTNDLADPSASPIALAQSLYDMARHLAQIVGVREVLLMQCFFRTTSGRYSSPDPQYNSRVHQFNEALKALAFAVPYSERQIHYNFFRGMVKDWEQYIGDGCHFNQPGLAKYARVVRRVIIKSANRVRKLLTI